jgi:hypothetical protein
VGKGKSLMMGEGKLLMKGRGSMMADEKTTLQLMSKYG